MDGDYQFSGAFDHLNGKTPRNGCRKRPPKSDSSADGFCPLVPKDGLFARIFPGGSSSAEAKARTVGIEHALRPTFITFWASIPEHDRQILLGYFHQRHDLPTDWPAPRYKPLIQILDLPFSSATCEHCGLELTFAAILIEKAAQRLPFEIARLLASVLLYANRRHWRLVQETIEEPLARWEQNQVKVTDTARNKKIDALEKDFLVKHHAEMDEILSRWGVQEPPPCDEQGASGG